MATSTFQPSMSNGMHPSAATQSTINRAGWLAESIARRMAAMSLTTDEAVSICTTRIALISWAVSAARRLATAAGSTARRQSPFSTSTLMPIIRTMSPQPTAINAIKPGAAEDPVGREEQHRKKEEVGQQAAEACAQQGIEVAGGQALKHADERGADHGAGRAVEAPDHEDREHLKPDDEHARAASRAERPQDAGDDGQGAGHRPRDREMAGYVDPHRERDLLVVRDGPEGQSGSRESKERADACHAQQRADGREHLLGREQHPEHAERIRREGRWGASRDRADHRRDRPADQGSQPEGDHDGGDQRPAEQVSQDQSVEADTDRGPRRARPHAPPREAEAHPLDPGPDDPAAQT